MFGRMMRKQRGRVASTESTSSEPCAVCGLTDGRALLAISLPSGERVSLCGSHELMHRRAGAPAASAAELRALFTNRRSTDRRGGKGEIDELAESLSAAFCRDRRVTTRRAS
jgi:hypothetical protein